MHIFQEWVPKKYEVRVTVVDGRFFAARIDAMPEAAYVDWRSDYHSISYSVMEIPDVVQSRVRTLLDSLGLRFGALDFVVDRHDQWWFLECNLAGQWLWLQDEASVQIAAGIADLLVSGEGR
jgi:glutathione synthase/RimK-type ligase-like ATP-grasp enzyme